MTDQLEISVKMNPVKATQSIFEHIISQIKSIVSASVRTFGTRFYLRVINRIKNDETKPKSISSILGRYPTLYNTGSFVDSINLRFPTFDSFQIFSTDKRASILHTGGSIAHPGGTPYMVVTDKATGGKKIAWLKKNDKRAIGKTKPHTIRIPAFGWLKQDRSTDQILEQMQLNINDRLSDIKIK